MLEDRLEVGVHCRGRRIWLDASAESRRSVRAGREIEPTNSRPRHDRCTHRRPFRFVERIDWQREDIGHDLGPYGASGAATRQHDTVRRAAELAQDLIGVEYSEYRPFHDRTGELG